MSVERVGRLWFRCVSGGGFDTAGWIFYGLDCTILKSFWLFRGPVTPWKILGFRFFGLRVCASTFDEWFTNLMLFLLEHLAMPRFEDISSYDLCCRIGDVKPVREIPVLCGKLMTSRDPKWCVDSIGFLVNRGLYCFTGLLLKEYCLELPASLLAVGLSSYDEVFCVMRFWACSSNNCTSWLQTPISWAASFAST